MKYKLSTFAAFFLCIILAFAAQNSDKRAKCNQGNQDLAQRAPTRSLAATLNLPARPRLILTRS